jgi:hypothetical protein
MLVGELVLVATYYLEISTFKDDIGALRVFLTTFKNKTEIGTNLHSSANFYGFRIPLIYFYSRFSLKQILNKCRNLALNQSLLSSI